MITSTRERLLELPSGRLAFVGQDHVDAALQSAPGVLPVSPGSSAALPGAHDPRALVFALGDERLTVQIARVACDGEQAGLMVSLDPDAPLNDASAISDTNLRFVESGWFIVYPEPLLVADPITFASSAHDMGLASPVPIRRLNNEHLLTSFVVLAGGKPVGIYLATHRDLEAVYPPRTQIERPQWIEGSEVFNGVDLRGREFAGQDLRGRSFDRSDLRGANLVGADLSRSSFVECLASGAILTDSTLIQVDLTDAWLQDADLSRARLGHAVLENADLHGANLCGAVLRGAKLGNACLRSADLRGADLREAELRGADLTDAELTDAALTGAKLPN